MNKLLSYSLLALGVMCGKELRAQTSSLNPITTAVPSLGISPDARGAALGDVGVATSADVYAQYWNAAKYAFAPERYGVGMSYTPWMTKLVSGMALMQLSGYYQLDRERKHALGASLRYFKVGEVSVWDSYGVPLDQVRPHDYALDVSYSYRFLPELSASVTLRYIRSDYSGIEGRTPVSALVGDLSLYMRRGLRVAGRDARWMAGLALKNVGGKVSYDNGMTKQFLPTSISLGTGLELDIAQEHRLMGSLELSKLLVPTPPLLSSTMSPAERLEVEQQYRRQSSWAALIRSWGDAPGGLTEELQEVRWGLGLEYSYADRFFGRLDYSYQHPKKGNLQSLNIGGGFKAKAFAVDATYLVALTKHNPLDQTFRFSLSFDIEGIRQMLR